VKKRFTEEQIIGFLREAESGLAVAALCRRHSHANDLSPVEFEKQYLLKLGSV